MTAFPRALACDRDSVKKAIVGANSHSPENEQKTE